MKFIIAGRFYLHLGILAAPTPCCMASLLRRCEPAASGMSCNLPRGCKSNRQKLLGRLSRLPYTYLTTKEIYSGYPGKTRYSGADCRPPKPDRAFAGIFRNLRCLGVNLP